MNQLPSLLTIPVKRYNSRKTVRKKTKCKPINSYMNSKTLKTCMCTQTLFSVCFSHYLLFHSPSILPYTINLSVNSSQTKLYPPVLMKLNLTLSKRQKTFKNFIPMSVKSIHENILNPWSCF